MDRCENDGDVEPPQRRLVWPCLGEAAAIDAVFGIEVPTEFGKKVPRCGQEIRAGGERRLLGEARVVVEAYGFLPEIAAGQPPMREGMV